MNPNTSCHIQKEEKGYTVHFRHSIVQNNDGQCGLKVYRSLGTADATEAQRLAAELEKLLSDSYWADSNRKAEAYELFDEVVVDAYYDPLEGANSTNEDLLYRIKLPSKEDGYTRQTFVGKSGAGKTSLLRLLAGTGTEKFPATSSSRTTTCNLELILSEDEDYEVVVTFMSRYLVELYVLECIEAALGFCKKCVDFGKNRNDISGKLFTHQDSIFKMSYIIGDLSLETKKPDPLDEEFEFEENCDIEKAPMNIRQDTEHLLERVNSYVDRLIQIAQDMHENNIDIEDENEAFNPSEDNDILSLRNEMVEDIMTRFCFLEGGEKLNAKGQWTNAWYFKTKDREEFIQTIKRFTGNDKNAWGSLLSPVVKTMRVKGMFKPEFCEKVPRLVLFDGQGLGHKTAMSSMPTDLITYLEKSDGIVIVDNAKEPIFENTKMAIQTAIEYGYSEKVCLAFTHVDAMEGDNFANFSDRKKYVLAELDSYIREIRRQNKDILSETEATQMMESCFYFSKLDSQKISRISKQYGNDLIALWQDKLKKNITVDMISLSYNTIAVRDCLLTGIEHFRTLWENKLRSEHYSRIKALTRRLGYFGIEHYQWELMPLADFNSCIRRELNVCLNCPLKVEPAIAEDDKKITLINTIKSTIHGKLQDLAREQLWRDSDQLRRWKDAYNYTGKGSATKRAAKVNEIFEFIEPESTSVIWDISQPETGYVSQACEIVDDVLAQYGCQLE